MWPLLSIQSWLGTFKIHYLSFVKRQVTAIIEREGEGYVAHCASLDTTSQGKTIQEAKENLIEALKLFFNEASDQRDQEKFDDEIVVTQVKV